MKIAQPSPCSGSLPSLFRIRSISATPLDNQANNDVQHFWKGGRYMWQSYLQPTSLAEALDLLQHYTGQARLVAGGTDVLVELQRGVKPTTTLIDISALHDLKYVRYEDGYLYLGALATHNDVVASAACVQYALPLAQACWEVGAPQICTRATVAGNLITASPANDTITPLMALNAEVVLVSAEGERVVPLHDFYVGVRRIVLKPNELLRRFAFLP